ncbi:MAG TPA: hypothetical protein VIU12_17410 [Chryseolinea sp.]
MDTKAVKGMLEKNVVSIAVGVVVVSLLMGYFILTELPMGTPIERNDIYARCAKGETINYQLFRKTQRIIKTDKWYFLWFDLHYEDTTRPYAPHLLVCDHSLVLRGGIIIN